MWKLPLGGTKTAEISVPLIVIPAKAGPAQLAAEGQSREPGVAGEAARQRGELAAVEPKLAATSTIPESETEIARAAALKHAPRFAADEIEKAIWGRA